MKNVKHYEKTGKIFTGKTHKHPDGTLMSGTKMGKNARTLLHYGALSASAKKNARSQW